MRRATRLLPVVLLLLSPLAARAGTLQGRVLDSAGQTPVPGATIRVFHLGDGTLFSATPTGPDGSYTIEALPAGPYDLAVETARGLWLGDALLTLPEDGTTQRSFSLRERAYWEGLEQMPARDTSIPGNIVGMAMTIQDSDLAPGWSAKRKGLVWGLLGGAAALALLSGGDSGDDDQPASPSAP